MDVRVKMLRLVGVLCLSLLPACASMGTLTSGDGEVEFGADAPDNMRRGEEAMEGKNFTEAARYFEFVKTKYPFLEASKTAELRLADCDFERERFAEARDRYQAFGRLHPEHAKVDYAAFRAALTHYKEIPSDFFLLPPASEKDQVEVRNALGAMTEFVRGYPKSPLLGDAQTVVTEVKRRLAEHELYVAEFYARRDRWPAVVTRLSGVAKNYPGIGYDETVYFGLHDAWSHLKDEAKAREALEQYVSRFPDGPGVKKARALLGGTAPAPATPDAGR